MISAYALSTFHPTHMKKAILSVVFLIVTMPLSYSQVRSWKSKFDRDSLTTKEPILGAANIPWLKSDFVWNPNMALSMVDFSVLSNPKSFLQTDVVPIHTKYFNFIPYTHFSELNKVLQSEIPSSLNYVLTLGLRIPLLASRSYLLSANSNLFWLSMGNGNKYPDAQAPIFLDGQIRFDYKYFLSAFAGIRYQFSDWKVTYGAYQDVIYSNNIGGFYFGITVGLGYVINKNLGKENWEQAKSLNTTSSFSSFLSRYPHSPYNKEASGRIEYLTFKHCLDGSVADCDTYLNKYPSGKYIQTALSRKIQLQEDIAYQKAIQGTITDCENYLNNYKSGRYLTEARNLRQEKIDKPEKDLYALAMTGTIADCENYLRNYPNGKYLNEVSKLKNDKYENEESATYKSAINGNSSDCKRYLEKYPNGKYFNEVEKLSRLKSVAEEAEIYSIAIKGTYSDCENYLNRYPNGKYVMLVKSSMEQIKASLMREKEKETYNLAIAGNVNDAQTYLNKYPNGEYSQEIEKKLTLYENEYYLKAKSGDYIAIEFYKKTFPKSIHFNEIQDIRPTQFVISEKLWRSDCPGRAKNIIIQRLPNSQGSMSIALSNSEQGISAMDGNIFDMVKGYDNSSMTIGRGEYKITPCMGSEEKEIEISSQGLEFVYHAGIGLKYIKGYGTIIMSGIKYKFPFDKE